MATSPIVLQSSIRSFRPIQSQLPSLNPPSPPTSVTTRPQSHRLLPQVVLDERSPLLGRIRDDDGSGTIWDELYSLVPIIVVLLSLVGLGFVLGALSNSNTDKEVFVGGSQTHLLALDTRDYEEIQVNASFLFLDSTRILGPLYRSNGIPSKVDSGDGDGGMAKHLPEHEETRIHVFYGAPPPVILAASTITRNVSIPISSSDKAHTFSAFRYELIAGGEGAPEFLILRSKEAFDMWMDDTFPPPTHRVHEESVQQNSSFSHTITKTDVYYLLFTVPSYFWPPCNATINLQMKFTLAEYDLTPALPSIYTIPNHVTTPPYIPHGTLDPKTVLLTYKLTPNPSAPSPFTSLLYAVLDIFGLSVGLALGLFGVAYWVGLGVRKVLVWWGYDEVRDGECGCEEDEEALPEYTPVDSTVMVVNGGSDRSLLPPGYTSLDALTVRSE
ncbi:hypothetical protein BCR33DRAFT_716172 [Rhizoclosmatium globosum]|uniref:Uncharacterized protein n=1 Tax=Rhizoclosmatium globosum TaxID=329046 RepID=A0A1Y2CEJ8_9FUNG|nr:hypothetical protein BCR33DRAFT_716172 [Rhizoclosmatium globosum]|eukprot:ORY45488.1 hypothetical protein BCR33DRAFT_716172 [Rhizoclosmatium globosum]